MNSASNSILPTPLQQACLARSLLSPSGGHYLQQLVCDWIEPLNLDAWQKAWNLVSARYDALRMYFGWDQNRDLLVYFAENILMPTQIMPVVSNEACRNQVLSDFLLADRRRGFDLATAPLWRLTIFPWAGGPTTTIWTFHHSLLDGRSHALVWQAVEAAYRALLAGTPAALPPANAFREFSEWLAVQPEAAAAVYWRECLRGFQTATDLPTLSCSADSGDDDAPPAMEALKLDAELTTRLRAAAERHGVTLNNLVQGSWALALARYQGVEEVIFGVVRSGRHWTDLTPNDRVGLFINTIPFPVHVSPSQQLGPWLQDLRTQQLAARAGEHASAEQIRRWCGLPRSTVLFRTVLMFENRDPSEIWNTPGQHLQLIEKTDLPSFVAYAGKSLTLTLDYSPRRHPAAQIKIILRHVQTLLEALAAAAPDAGLGELPMLPPEDRRLTLEHYQGPVTTTPAPAIHRVIEAQAARTPELPAVEFQDRALTYAELNRQANQLARRLLQWCQPGERIAVVLDHAPDQAVVWLAALKSGVVYAPLDPANPRERLKFLFEDLQPAVLLTHQMMLPLLPAGNFRVLLLDAPGEPPAADSENLPRDPPREAPANLFYTSGTTGVPKGAINSFAGLDNFAEYLRRDFDFGPGDRVLQSSSPGFDGSMFDFVAALQCGATLVLVPPEQLRPGPGFSRMLSEQRISTCLLTPSTLRSSPAPAPPVLRVLFAGGEALTVDVLQRWSPGRRLFNVCGPTECSIWYQGEESHADGNRPTIGRFIQNCRGYVLDANRQLVPIGVPGELYLGGVGVGLGYWRRPDLNAEKYFPDPFASEPAAEMYRTGDRVRWLADGRIEPLGRLDFQIKVQGVRVELGEIEMALRRHPAVADAMVGLHENRLLAWFIPRGEAPSASALSAWLADHIAQIFTPSEFHPVPEFPRTLTGKIHRAELINTWLAARHQKETTAAKLAAEERRQVMEKANQTARPYPLDRSVVEFFQEQVQQRPEAPALQWSNKIVTYAALNARANRLAQQLLRSGLQPEDIVALRFERSIAFVLSALAVLKAGGTYLPLDARIPAARQDFVLADSGARYALMAKEYLDSLADWRGWSASVEDDEANPSAEFQSDPAVPGNPRRRAYVIYTSGSTGRPKGVEIEHRSLTNLVCFYRERLQLTPQDRATLIANPTFDASVADLWPALCVGATVLIPDRKLLDDPDGLIAWLAKERATFSFVPTALGELMFHRAWPQPLALRFFCVGGEALRLRPPVGLPFAIINSYGPTENTVDATWETVLPKGDGLPDLPGIGQPIANVRAYVLNDDLAPVAAGLEGELFLGGAQVARGYLHRPELTAEKFLTDPFSADPGARMYRTGDRVCLRSDGNLEFRGRKDDQVQVRGQRVELGEIEAVLRQHPGVREVCCRPFVDPLATDPVGAGLVVAGVTAHVVMPGISAEQVTSELRQFLAPRLPSYMVPAIFVSHGALPLTPQGKLDRMALDSLVQTRPGPSPNLADAAPADSLVRVMTELWQRTLPAAGGTRPDQTFQELGGDSLRAVKLLLGVEELTGRRLALSTFLLEPTLSGLCRAVKSAEEESQTPILALRRSGGQPPIICLYNLDGDVGAYFELCAELGPDQPVFGIRSSALHHVDRVPDSIETAARQVRALLREAFPRGPFALVGFSWAGLVAFEMARQYAHEEDFIPFCALLGTLAPPHRPPLAARLFHAVRWLPTWAWRLLQDRGHRWHRLRRAITTARFFRNLGAGEKPLVPPWATTQLARELINLAHQYQPAINRPVPIHLFRERASFHHESHPAGFIRTDHLEDGGWGRWAGTRPAIHWLDSDHTTALKRPQVTHTAAQLRSALAKHFTATSSSGQSTQPNP